MSKILGSWSGMRKYLEQEMLSDSLKGRIRYGCTAYPGMDGLHIFEIFIDSECVKRFSWETVNSFFIRKGLKPDNEPYGEVEYWTGFWETIKNIPLNERTEYTDEEFCNALEFYRQNDIQASIKSDNSIVRMLAVSDRRLGKRTLLSLKDDIEIQPDWLKRFYELRLSAEFD